MSKPDPTIYDVAREAGVSIATVSRVLNFPHRVNAQTRNTVINAIEKLGYIPKAESRARALMGTRRIGVLIPFFTEPSFVQRLRGIGSVLNKKDYEMVVYPVDSKERSLSYLETLPIRKMLDGLIIVSQVFDETITKRLLDNRLETVTIEYYDFNFTSLMINDEKGGELATYYLFEKGYERIAFVGGQKNPVFGVDPITKRMNGYKKAILNKGLDLPEILINEYVYNHKQVLEKIIALGLPVAIFAATDLQAIALIKEARLMGLRIPQDIAIIGFDNIDMAEFFGLTTVHQPLDESGRIAASLLISRLSNPSQSTQHIELPLKIIQRETA
ncbi:MAG TPA: LacI family DNA-binding transcriptional regulator [Anaerolineaceae bacterium]|nr:LacI family DNA-binding transcriptional regulator [Anaerolineaceae bacterium]